MPNTDNESTVKKKSLKSLKAKRNGLRSHLSRYLQDADDELAKGDNADYDVLAKNKERVSQFHQRVEIIDEEILQLLEEDALDEEVTATTDFTAKVTDCLIDLENRKAQLQQKIQFEVRSRHEGMSETNNSVITEGGHVQRQSAKLPKLTIEKFNGDPLKFQEFWDAFESSIHLNETLNPVDKFNYLKSLLECEAGRSLRGLGVTNANYQAAVDAVKERFGNKQVVIFAHFEEFFRLSQSPKETSKLRNTLDECEKHIRALEALGVTEEKFGIVLVPLILSKLPEDVRINLNRKNSCETWELATLRKLLKDEILARELGELKVSGYEKGQDRKNRAGVVDCHASATAESLLSGEVKVKRCVFCQGQHFSDECRKFADVDSRRRQVKDRCFGCLRRGHMISACPNPSMCYYCKRKHHRSMCPQKFPAASSSKNERGKAPVLNVDAREFSPQPQPMMLTSEQQVIMQTAVTEVVNLQTGRKCKARILFDTGSQRTFTTQKIMKNLELLPTENETVSVATFGSQQNKTVSYPLVNMGLRLKNGSLMKLSANVSPVITCSVLKNSLSFDEHTILNELPLADPTLNKTESIVVDILVGNDYYFDIVSSERIALSESLYLIRSSLGWIATGRTNKKSNNHSSNLQLLLLKNSTALPYPEEQMQRMWRLESIGITEPAKLCDDDMALAKFNNTVQFTKGRYQVTWPWKEENPDLPDNCDLALKRLKMLIKKISKNPDLMAKYKETIEEQLRLGIIERVTDETPQASLKHYIAHHCVVKMDRATTKVRIVYDASAKVSPASNSLNDCLYRGPVLLQNLVGMLLRFRLSPVAILSDIEKAFLQVGLQTPDRDVTRFLWLKDPNRLDTENNVETFRFQRVPFGVVSSPFLLSATVAYHLKGVGTTTALEISHNIYVDNVLSGKANKEDAQQFYVEAKQLFSDASMNLREWVSNCSEFIESIPEKDRAKGKTAKVLGLRWTTEDDTLTINGPKCEIKENMTKRDVVRTVSQVFDPLGCVSPITIKAKILMQRLWKQDTGWDQKLSADFTNEWHAMDESLRLINTLTIPRYLNLSSLNNKFELHCFTDASSLAYACCVYLKSCTANTATKLVFSKARLAPLKEVSMPRLELLAVCIGVRATQFVAGEIKLDISKKYLWTDSKCVLYWLKSPKLKPRFVENRLREIRKHTEVTFRYVPTEENPADIPSRGATFCELKNSDLWWSGPPWLSKESNGWPESLLEKCLNEEDDCTMPIESSSVLLGVDLNQILDLKDYSSLKRLLRVTGWIFEARSFLLI